MRARSDNIAAPSMGKLIQMNAAAVDPELAPGTMIDGRYEIVRTIGRGGDALVYEVEHARTGRRLALKSLLDAGGLPRLVQEARACALLKNAHTAKVVDLGTTSEIGPYLVMDLLEGYSLRDLLDAVGQLPLRLAVNLALQVSECLAEAHALGLVHRDLKPENVFLCPSPLAGQYDVKVLDFGIVKVKGGALAGSHTITRAGGTVGTPHYMSLEQLRNSSAVDERADVYALGVMLYEALTGKKPFHGDTIGDLVYAICSGPPPHVAELRPDVPDEVADAVMRALARRRDERPESMVDLADALTPWGDPVFAGWLEALGRGRLPGEPRTIARAPWAAAGNDTDAEAFASGARWVRPRKDEGEDSAMRGSIASGERSLVSGSAEITLTGWEDEGAPPVPDADAPAEANTWISGAEVTPLPTSRAEPSVAIVPPPPTQFTTAKARTLARAQAVVAIVVLALLVVALILLATR